MTTVPLKYANAVRDILTHLEETQQSSVEQAADLVIHALSNGGAVFCRDIGHGNHLDFMNRAGGLAAVQHFTFGMSVTSAVPECMNGRPRPEPFDDEAESIRYAIHAGNLRPGDVILLSSVSGRNTGPIEFALQCRDYGVKTIGFTSVRYADQSESKHASGKLLNEVVDVCIDIGAPYGDAAVEVPGYDYNALPVSGVSMIVAGWMIWGRVMEKMAAAGNPPSVFMSVNREGGPEHYAKTVEQYQKRGY